MYGVLLLQQRVGRKVGGKTEKGHQCSIADAACLLLFNLFLKKIKEEEGKVVTFCSRGDNGQFIFKVV